MPRYSFKDVVSVTFIILMTFYIAWAAVYEWRILQYSRYVPADAMIHAFVCERLSPSRSGCGSMSADGAWVAVQCAQREVPRARIARC